MELFFKMKDSTELVDKIMALEKEIGSITSLSSKDLSYFSKKYLDLLELKELEYNITNYAS